MKIFDYLNYVFTYEILQLYLYAQNATRSTKLRNYKPNASNFNLFVLLSTSLRGFKPNTSLFKLWGQLNQETSTKVQVTINIKGNNYYEARAISFKITYRFF